MKDNSTREELIIFKIDSSSNLILPNSTVYMKCIPTSLLAISLLTLSFISCKQDDPFSGPWLVPTEEVFDGGPGKDGIPSIDNPQFIDVSAATYLHDDDLVIGFRVGDEIRAYSHPILDRHEIVNDRLGSVSIAITYCPLTGSAIGWDRMVNGSLTSFGVSGALYNTNLIPYDRATDSNWSQMRLDCINGELINTRIQTHTLVETSWKTWKAMYPNSQVLSTETGFSRSYTTYPYGDYRSNDESLLFPISVDDERLNRKDRVLGVLIEEDAKAYPLSAFAGGTRIIEEAFAGIPLVVVGNESDNFIAAFESQLDTSQLTFSPTEAALPIVMEDQEGTQWDIFGYAVSGPRAGARLKPMTAYIGYWFAWGTFYPGLALYE